MSEISRRNFIRMLGAAAATTPLVPAWGGTGLLPNPNSPPNIILILADDMGFSDLGCYGSEIDTPHIDALAESGIRLTQFYNTARCCPTRASLLTGLYAHQAGVGHMTDDDYGIPGYRGDLNRQCVTIAEALRPAGYTTLMCGKWHVTPANESKHNWPRQRGFDRFFGTIVGAGSYFDPTTLTLDNESIKAESDDFYYTTSIAEHAVQFIEEYGGRGKPFFLYAAFTSPHWPLHALDRDIRKYQGHYDMGWDELRAERHKRMVEMGLVEEKWPLTPRDERVPAWKDAEDKAWQARRMEVYAAQVDSLDQAVGRIVSKLREMGVEENTLILFLADNGGCAEEITSSWKAIFIPTKTRAGRPVKLGNDPSVMPGPEETYQSYGIPWANASNTPFRLYKHWVHEGGIATPLIVHWPAGIKQPNTLRHEPGHLIDIMATCVDVARAEYPKTHNDHEILPLEGESLARLFRGETFERRKSICWEHEGNRAVREGKWKLVSRYSKKTGGHWELYDLEADRTEMKDLAGENPTKVAELMQIYESWARRSRVVSWRSWERW